MEINAKISTALNQVIIVKQLETGSYRISRADAKHLHNTGRITKSNRCFQRLAALDFDTTKLLGFYQAEREGIDKARKRAGTSSTDDR